MARLLHQSSNDKTGRAPRGALYFGLAGGAAAWTLHLLAAYLVAEFGCIAGLAERTLWSVSAVAWLIIAASGLLLVVAAAATLAAHRTGRRLRAAPPSPMRRNDAYLARLGLITSGLFVLVIAFQTLPIFFYLRHC